MSLSRFALALIAVLALLASTSIVCAQPLINARDGEADSLARFVERRAGHTSFAALDAFGREAMTRHDREGLNRLYHVTWTILNQGEFEQAEVWNRRLEAAARRQSDARYMDIARLNALTVRYDRGEAEVATEMARMAQGGRDWFVRAHAARLSALTLMDAGRVGEGLERLAEAQADIPVDAPFANTAQAGIWEVVGMGLKDLNDVEGAAAAFRKFEVEYSNPAYPRPDFDSLYNMTKMAAEVGDLDRAARFAAAHHRLAVRADLPTLRIYDASLCAMVASARSASRDVLACLEPYGEDLGEAAFLSLDTLPLRAIARARTGDPAGARRDLDKLRAIATDAGPGSDVAHVEAEVLFAEGRTAEAYRLLRSHMQSSETAAALSFSSGIHQVTGNMQQQLAERREQLETARSNTHLQQLMLAIVVVFLSSAIGVMVWQWRQAGQLRIARRRAEDANHAKSEFLANMSHEIRTPLNGVVSMADALARRDLDPQEREMVELICSSGATLERLLSDILDSAKIESGQVTIEPTVFDLKHGVGDVALLWRAKAEDKGVALTFDFDASLPKFVEGDAVRLRQVLTNLVSNALKFTADGSITRRYGGTGLGLAISSALVELMGGALECDSTPGEGATFWFEVPLPRAETPVAVQTEADAPIEVGEAPLRILLADDHPANRKVVEIMLAATPMELVAVEDGQQALDAFAGGGFDLVLMDMQMPVMDGLTATREIRALEQARGLARTPVLMLTANAMAEHVEAGRLAGADGHLTKPITLQALFDAIGAALEPAGRMDQAA